MSSWEDWVGKEVRVRFDLEVEDDFPPISAELLIGVVESEGRVRLDNTPFFVEGVALGDILKCRGTPPDLIFHNLIEESGHRAISVLFVDSEYAGKLYNLLKAMQCYVEFGEFPDYDMIAAAVPPAVNYSDIRELLESAESDGLISFAELCVQ